MADNNEKPFTAVRKEQKIDGMFFTTVLKKQNRSNKKPFTAVRKEQKINGMFFTTVLKEQNRSNKKPFTAVRKEQKTICTSTAAKGFFPLYVKGHRRAVNKRQVMFFCGLCHADTELIEMPGYVFLRLMPFRH